MSTFFFSPLIIESFLFLMIVLILFIDLFMTEKKERKNAWILVVSLIALLFLLSWVILFYPSNASVFLSGHFIWDPLGALLSLTILSIYACALSYAYQAIQFDHFKSSDYSILGLFSLFGMLVLVSANSWLSLYLGLELMSLPAYALVALETKNKASTEAAVKYILVNIVASAFLLYGFSFLYSLSPQSLFLNNGFIKNLEKFSPFAQFGGIFILIALVFKLGGAPFHWWVAEVYQGASIPAGLLIVSAPKVAIVGVMVRLLRNSFFEHFLSQYQLLIIFGVISVGLGNLIIITQTQVKRLLAYSSIAHLGYILIGLGLSREGHEMAIFYSITYGLTVVAAFGVFSLLQSAQYPIESINNLKGLADQHRIISFCLLCIMLSMAGLPPFIGFFSKVGILHLLLIKGFYKTSGAVLGFTLLGVYAYFNLIRLVYFQVKEEKMTITVNKKALTILALNSGCLLVAGLFPDLFIFRCKDAISILSSFFQ